MKKFSNDTKINLALAVWLAVDEYKHVADPMHISATGLLKSVKQITLLNRLPEPEPGSILHDADLEDISARIPVAMGNALHSAIEHAWINHYQQSMVDLGYPKSVIERVVVNPDPAASLPNNSIPVYLEKRIEKKLGPFTISGQFDMVVDGQLSDVKSTGVYAYMHGSNDEKFRLQGSIYRWLNPQIITNDWMTIQYIFTDWSRTQAMVQAKSNYPQSRVLTHPLELLSQEETLAWMKQKLQAVYDNKDLDEAKIPECTPEELWQQPAKFKYFKNPAGKRATKVYDNYYQANAHFVKDGSVGKVDTIPGKVRACGYCQAFPICKQKDIYLDNGTLA